MDGGDRGLRVTGAIGGFVLLLPTMLFAALLLTGCPSCQLSILFGGFAAGLLVATIAVADGQAWGAAVIGLYGVAMGIRYGMAVTATPYATTQDIVLVALHVSIGILSALVTLGLVAAHGPRDAR